MKKIVMFALLILFAVQPMSYASSDRIEMNLLKKDFQVKQNKTDAFENNYQKELESDNPQMSQIEQLFNGKEVSATGKILKQAGYDLFSSTATSSSTVGKYDDSYKLNIGEKVTVYSMGDSLDIMSMSGSNLITPASTSQVDSKGMLFLSGIGMIKAENRTIKDVENEANRIAKQKYKNLKIRLTVASGQEFTVFVYGHVKNQGKVLVGNNSSVFDALNAAGGVKKTGTLRNIKYTSNNKTTTIDLYKALFFGNDEGVILHPNDKIFVGNIGSIAAIKNGVSVPAIYEIKDGETIQNIVAYAGGFLPATQITDVTLTGLDTATNQRVARNLDKDSAKTTVLRSGDSVEFRELYNMAENVVTIQGNIKHPSTYAYKDGMRLSDILKSEDELLEETFITQAVIRRVSGKNNQIETIPVFLKEFYAGMNDPILQPRDIINIYKNTSSQFVDVFGCVNMPKHLTYKKDMKLYDIMTDIQFLESDTESDISKAVEENSNTDENSEKPVAYNASVEENDVQFNVTTANQNKIIPADKVAVEVTNANGETQVYYLYDILVNSDRIKYIPLEPDDKVFFRPLRDNEILKSVKISGFVKKPAVYSFIEGKRLSDLIEQSGGLMNNADLRGIVFKRSNLHAKQVELAKKNNERDIKLLEGRIASGYKQSEADQNTKLEMINMLKDEVDELDKKYTGQIALNIKYNDLKKLKDIDNIELQDGDDIYIPRISNHVCVIGEVYNEQSFVYTPGAKAKTYIKQVGGYTPNANKFRLYKVGVNGRAVKIHGGTKIAAGDTIVVPKRIAGNDWITPICDTLRGLASVVVMAFAVNKW